MNIYQKVHTYIDDHGLHLATVAKKAGISAHTLHAILTGKRTMYAEDLKAICAALNVSAEVFIKKREIA